MAEGMEKEYFRIMEESRSRRYVPKAVRETVWARDGGRCVECDSDNNLQFDHIIPHSKGGSNTENNIQILCQNCNLKKSDRIGI